MQERAVIRATRAQDAERLRRGRPEANRKLNKGPSVDEMVQQLLADQFWEVEEEVRDLRSRNPTEPFPAQQARQGSADDSRPAGR